MDASGIQKYGLIGRRLSHSFSPDYFLHKFAQLSLPHRYTAYELAEVGQLRSLLTQEKQLVGLNVTIPYKAEVMPLLDSLSPEAKAIGAVNTIYVQRDAADGGVVQLVGHNTDWTGFWESLLEAWMPVAPYTAMVLGTGGASKAVLYALRQDVLCMGILQVSRTPTKGGAVHQIAYEALTPALLASCALVVNTTPLGMYPDVDTCPDLPWEGCHAAQHYYDLIYNPEQTLFMQQAASRGASVQNGLQMLHLQAEAAWQLWQQYLQG